MQSELSVVASARKQTAGMTYETFCGGMFETNCYLISAPEGWILFDAPDGACDWLESRQVDLKLLLLTHGHIDHIQDVAKIKHRFGCPIGCHPETAPMISDREFFRNFGFELEIEPVQPDFMIEETPARNFLGLEMQVLEVPGHCPGSLCAKTNSSSAATCFSPVESDVGIYRAEMSIFCSEESERKYFRLAIT